MQTVPFSLVLSMPTPRTKEHLSLTKGTGKLKLIIPTFYSLVG